MRHGVIEFRQHCLWWDIAHAPRQYCQGKRASLASAETLSFTSRIFLRKRITFESLTAIPQLSWPLCCSAKSPKAAKRAASELPNTPMIPHIYFFPWRVNAILFSVPPKIRCRLARCFITIINTTIVIKAKRA
jgi:hypothetical protein